jgi:hypothetical protein
MTRTERASYPRALEQDRHSRTGLNSNPNHVPKHGAGHHSWGSQNGSAALEDELNSYEDEPGITPADEVDEATNARRPPEPGRKSSQSLTEEERKNALNIRKNALKDGEPRPPPYLPRIRH